MHIGGKKGFLGKISVVFLIAFFSIVIHQPVSADLSVNDIVDTSNIARPANQTLSNLPIETYFGDPSYNSWQEQLKAQNITIYPEDKVSTFPDASFGLGSIIRIARATPVKILDGNQANSIRTWGQSVSQVLTEQNIELADADKVSPSLSSPILPNETITITRVEISTLTETEVIPFSTTNQDDPTLDQGKTKIKQVGVNGEKSLTYQVKRENQVEVSRDLVSSQVTIAPINQITLIGTKPVITVSCRYNSIVISASSKYGLDPNGLCHRMMAESNGNPNSDGGQYKGLFQYTASSWANLSAKAGYGGSSIWNAEAQIYTTAWAWTHGYRSYWPNP